MTYSRAKVQGQRSVGSEDRVETNRRTHGWTKAIALPPTLKRSLNITGGECRGLVLRSNAENNVRPTLRVIDSIETRVSPAAYRAYRPKPVAIPSGRPMFHNNYPVTFGECVGAVKLRTCVCLSRGHIEGGLFIYA